MLLFAELNFKLSRMLVDLIFAAMILTWMKGIAHVLVQWLDCHGAVLELHLHLMEGLDLDS